MAATHGLKIDWTVYTIPTAKEAAIPEFASLSGCFRLPELLAHNHSKHCCFFVVLHNLVSFVTLFSKVMNSALQDVISIIVTLAFMSNLSHLATRQRNDVGQYEFWLIVVNVADRICHVGEDEANPALIRHWTRLLRG